MTDTKDRYERPPVGYQRCCLSELRWIIRDGSPVLQQLWEDGWSHSHWYDVPVWPSKPRDTPAEPEPETA